MDHPIDFLTVSSNNRLRREINNICDSYSNPWDILAELCQNAVDAINLYDKKFVEASGKKHRIEIEIDAGKRKIRIFDTGIGFSASNFRELLAPHGTDKDNKVETIGEKGVGLTYVIFTSNRFELKTQSTTARIEGQINQARMWREGKVDSIPLFETTLWNEKELSPVDTFTEITVWDVNNYYDENEDIFSLNIDTLAMLLRTKTAIGWLKGIFAGKSMNVDVLLTFIPDGHPPIMQKVKPEYWLPHEMLPSNKTIDLDEFKNQAAAFDDAQKARKLRGKAITKKGVVDRANKRINYYVFFAPTRNLWKEISERRNLVITANDGTANYLYQGGIYVGTKGMPTGIRLEPPTTGYAGYWPNFYIVLEDDSIVFDLGRKFVPGRTKGLLREIAKQLFFDVIPFARYISSDPPVKSTSPTIQQYQKNQVFESLKDEIPDLGLSNLHYLKHPNGQEAAVVALFNELIGQNMLKGYYTLMTGYKQTYDMWGIYKIDSSLVGKKYREYANNGIVELPIVVEFKYMADAILDDFQDDLKYFTDIDLIVCWDFDEKKFKKFGVDVEPLSEDEKLFFGSNFRLIWPGSYNLGSASEKPVLALRRFIQDLRSRR